MSQHTTNPIPLSGPIASDLEELLGEIHERFLETDNGELEREALARIAPLKRLNLRLYRGLEAAVNDLLISALDAGARLGYSLGQASAQGETA